MRRKRVSDYLKWVLKTSFLFSKKCINGVIDRRKVVERVLLPMMIFVHVDMYEQKEVLTLGSISRYMVLRGESTPAVIPDEQMHRFKLIGFSESFANASEQSSSLPHPLNWHT